MLGKAHVTMSDSAVLRFDATRQNEDDQVNIRYARQAL